MTNRTHIGIAVTCMAFALTYSVAARSVGINYERLSSLEVPLSTSVGGWTAVVTGLVDVGGTVNLRDEDDADLNLLANAELSIERQLGNRWTPRISYFAQIEGDMALQEIPDMSEEDFNDNILGSLSNPWGTVGVGNGSGVVREQTRRRRGTGNATLAYDAGLAELDDWSALYTGRYGPFSVGGVVDRKGGFDIGATYQRPLYDKDYRFTARYTDGTFESDDKVRTFDVRGAGLVAELTYGSTILDVGVGYDRLESGSIEADRAYVTAGAQHKWGAVTVSIAGHYGQIDGEEERSASFGARYDIARGLSANLGVNYAHSQVVLDGVRLTDEDDEITTTASLRYSF
jgi:hypothetical protein